MTSYFLYFEPADQHPTWLVVAVFFVPLVGGIALYLYKTRHARLWRRGIYPPNLKFTEDNLLEAYLALGSLLILLDYSGSRKKTQYINGYFNRFFTKANYNFGDSLLFSMRHPIKFKTVCDWLVKHLETEGERAQVIYFLTGIGMLDGNISDRELKFLDLTSQHLNLPKEHLKRIISIYSNYRKAEEKNKKETKSVTVNARKYAHILGVSENPTSKEVKSAYRNLVKEHHPDRFERASKAQRLIAEDKFREIREAYEFWDRRLKGQNEHRVRSG